MTRDVVGSQWRARLRGGVLSLVSDRRGIVLVAALVFLALFVSGLLPAAPAVGGFAAIAASAGLTPRRRAFADRAGPPVLPDAARLDGASIRAFADALADPCLILDRRDVVIHRNRAAALQFPEVALANPISLSLRHPAVLKGAEEARRTGLAQVVELHRTVPTETWHRVAIAPLLPAAAGWHTDGDRLLVASLQNVTESRRVEVMRQDFIANVSHELRTPLTSLIGFIDTLLGSAANDEAARHRFLEIMRGQAERMARLVEDLLSLSRIEMRQHLRPTGTVDLSSLLREVGEGVQSLASQAKISVIIDAPATTAPVTGDREELYEVFENLIDNAIKYGGSGGRVDVLLVPVTDRQGVDYMVSVTDYGRGVDVEHVPRLTERFYRVDAESSRKKKGTGLGLAIVKHIVNRHRGQISIRSRPGEGLRVEVLLAR